MPTLEDRLRPRIVTSPWRRDVLAVSLLVLLAVMLLPGWVSGLGPLLSGETDQQSTEQAADLAYYLNRVPGQMASFYLLLATGFALALRCGAVDLSVWSVAGAGGVAAAALMNLGAGFLLSFIAAACLGLAIGILNGLAVTRLKLPSAGVTLASGVGVTVLVLALTGGQAMPVPESGMDILRSTLRFPPLLIGRMLIVAGGWSVVMVVLLVADTMPEAIARPDRRRELMLALMASAVLSGLGGACWLIDRGEAPVQSWPIGDLRVVAAALLTGAAFLGGRGRTMIACLLLPLALLVATAWRQGVIVPAYRGLAPQGLMLICMVIVAQIAIDNALSRRQGSRWLAIAAMALVFSGTVMLGASAGARGLAGRGMLQLASMAIWVFGAVLLLLSRRSIHRNRELAW